MKHYLLMSGDLILVKMLDDCAKWSCSRFTAFRSRNAVPCVSPSTPRGRYKDHKSCRKLCTALRMNSIHAIHTPIIPKPRLDGYVPSKKSHSTLSQSTFRWYLATARKLQKTWKRAYKGQVRDLSRERRKSDMSTSQDRWRRALKLRSRGRCEYRLAPGEGRYWDVGLNGVLS